MTRLVRVSLPAKFLLLLISETILLFGGYLIAAFWTQPFLELYLYYDGGLGQIVFAVAIIQIGLYYQLLYETVVPRSRLLLIQQFCMVLGFAFLLQALAGYANWLLQLPKWTMIYGSLLALLVLPLWRVIYAFLVSRAAPVRKLLFLGGSPVVEDIALSVGRHSDLGLSVMGYLDAEAEPLCSVPRLGRVEDMDEVIRSQPPDRIVTALRGHHDRLPTRFLLDLQLSGIQIEEATTLFETLMGRISARSLQPSELIFSSTFEPQTANVALKTIYSVVLGTLVTIAALPIFVVATVLIKASSRGPVFLRHQRVGLRGEPFELYLFRADALTLPGRWIRRLHLEGLPQLFNILRGELSVVGPRAECPEFATVLESQIPFYRQRYCIKPGITGWAQVNFKGSTEMQDALTKLEYDLFYIKNMSPALDAYVLLHSFPSM
jgi:lipopolysaccharide/colanic/teichoic acid biosynthesis glycosyltransferase